MSQIQTQQYMETAGIVYLVSNAREKTCSVEGFEKINGEFTPRYREKELPYLGLRKLYDQNTAGIALVYEKRERDDENKNSIYNQLERSLKEMSEKKGVPFHSTEKVNMGGQKFFI